MTPCQVTFHTMVNQSDDLPAFIFDVDGTLIDYEGDDAVLQ